MAISYLKKAIRVIKVLAGKIKHKVGSKMKIIIIKKLWVILNLDSFRDNTAEKVQKTNN